MQKLFNHMINGITISNNVFACPPDNKAIDPGLRRDDDVVIQHHNLFVIPAQAGTGSIKFINIYLAHDVRGYTAPITAYAVMTKVLNFTIKHTAKSPSLAKGCP